MKQTEKFTPAALALSVQTAVLAESIPQGMPLRKALLTGLLGAVVLCILSVLAAAALQKKQPSCEVKAALTAALFLELLQIIGQAQRVCVEEFSSMALLGFLPLLLWVGWSIRPGGWNAPARVLWWFAALGGAICLLGLGGQMHWYRLRELPAGTTNRAWMTPVYAEYFALPLLCNARHRSRMIWLPVWSFALQGAVLLSGALLFGGSGYPQQEVLRAWSTGSFSRMDALLLLVWLLCAVYRIAVLCASIRLLWKPRAETEVEP